jgi:ATP-dependent RNA helicase DOB1
VSTGDELLLVELIFAGGFTDLSVEQTVSLLSCLVFEEKSNNPDAAPLRDDLAGPLQLLKETARRIVKVSNECNLKLDEQAYLDSFRPELMEVVWAWCKGAKFAKICTMTDVFEGSIIRCMRRLEELMRQLTVAAKAIGNDALEGKFSAGIALLKRDIVFASSLYL